MTDKEKAKEYCKSSKDFVKYTSETYKRRLGKAYLDGLKAGRKESLLVLICEQEHVEMLEKLHESDKRAIEIIMKKWEAERNELKAQIEKTKCCANCKHKNIYQYDFINECRLTGNQTNYEHKCDKWELAE